MSDQNIFYNYSCDLQNTPPNITDPGLIEYFEARYSAWNFTSPFSPKGKAQRKQTEAFFSKLAILNSGIGRDAKFKISVEGFPTLDLGVLQNLPYSDCL